MEKPVLKMVAEQLGKSPAQEALGWGLEMGHSVLPKSTSEARLKENLDIFNWSIPEDLFAKFSEIEQASVNFIFLFSFPSLSPSLLYVHVYCGRPYLFVLVLPEMIVRGSESVHQTLVYTGPLKNYGMVKSEQTDV
ncbi:hypothetical protein CRYUN_Cryun16bG0131700 [Craigia yunnanensis]